MEYKEIQELIKLISKFNLAEFKMKNGDFEIAIKTDKYTKVQNSAPVLQPAPVMAQHVAAPAPASASQSEAAAKAASESESKAPSNITYIKSPIVGTFYRSPTPDKPPYVKVGDTITPGKVVCIVEAMKLFNEIEAEVSGKIVQVLVEDASPVEYDQPLYAIEPA